jgi:hypothetical protein
MPKLEKILALLLIVIVDCVYKGKIIHNDILPSNNLLHSPLNHVDKVYIGMFDWDLASCIVEDTLLVSGFSTTNEEK